MMTAQTKAPVPARDENASIGALRLEDDIQRLKNSVKARKIAAILHRGLLATNSGDSQKGSKLALEALVVDSKCGPAWHLLAVCRERMMDFRSAFDAYEAALALSPDHAEIANDLGQLAVRVGQYDVAEQLFGYFLVRFPGHPNGVNNLACCLRDRGRHDEAIELLRPAILAHPTNAMLWNALATVVGDRGEIEQARQFFDESLTHEPGRLSTLYNRGKNSTEIGDIAAGLADMRAAAAGLPIGYERTMAEMAISTNLLALGQLEEGWKAYEARFSRLFVDAPVFIFNAPLWRPGTEIAGKRLMVIGEQGLGDEIMFANVLPDVVKALGPGGALELAVEPRLVALFARSFPMATVYPHKTGIAEGKLTRVVERPEDAPAVDLWTPMASLLMTYRNSLSDFDGAGVYMKPDPERIAYWKAELDALGPEPKVGLLWKSMNMIRGRGRNYSPFHAWRDVMATPGVRFVNIQYGDCAAELEQAKAEGLNLWTPEGINLKDDLDDLAALCAALDLIIGPSNATTNLAGAVGAPVFFLVGPNAWPRLGADRYPWYPQSRAFAAPKFNDWKPALDEIAAAVKETLLK